MKDTDLKALRTAVRLLENPSLGIKIADIIGTPVEKAIALLPNKALAIVETATHKAIDGALRLSLKTLDYHDPTSGEAPPEASKWWHVAMTATSGAVGGALGFLALAVELPLSTTIMMRSIADVARSEGADLNDIEVQFECVNVLALGGKSNSDDASEVGYFIAREALAKAVANAAAHVSKNGLSKEGAPAIVKLIAMIAERYSINVTEKVAAQAVPVVGAIGGALINTMFIDHFQNMSRGHFIVRRLEKEYGAEMIKEKYKQIRSEKA